jgi:hypothetical protein
MKRLLVHIGTSKTGTTAIQSSLLAAQRRGTLAVCYPDFSWVRERRQANPHAYLGYLYRKSAPPRVYLGKSGEAVAFLAAEEAGFRKEFADALSSQDNVILSAESLSALPPEEIARFREDLSAYPFDETAIVVYVRNPAQVYLSSAQQKLKASAIVRNPRNYHYRFRGVIRAWSRAFEGRIIVRPFDLAQLHQSCAVRDFVKVSEAFFGRDLGQVESAAANVSLSAEGMYILQKYRRAFYSDAENVFRADSNLLVRILTDSLGRIRQNRPRLRPEVAGVILRRHRKQLEWLRSQYGIDFPAAGNPAAGSPAIREGRLELDDIIEIDRGIVDELLLHVYSTVARPLSPR